MKKIKKILLSHYCKERVSLLWAHKISAYYTREQTITTTTHSIVFKNDRLLSLNSHANLIYPLRSSSATIYGIGVCAYNNREKHIIIIILHSLLSFSWWNEFECKNRKVWNECIMCIHILILKRERDIFKYKVKKTKKSGYYSITC